MKSKLAVSTLFVIMLLATGCGPATQAPAAATAVPPATPTAAVPVTGQGTATVVSAQGTPAGQTSPASTQGAQVGGTVVNLGQTAALGSFLVDSKGMTLYLFTKDTPNTSNCYSGCIGYWPPQLTTGAPVAGSGVTQSMLGTTKRADGTTQVTYNGWPLYYYIGDKAAGDTTGENVQNVWFVVTSAGAQK